MAKYLLGMVAGMSIVPFVYLYQTIEEPSTTICFIQ